MYLEIKDLCKRYADIAAVSDINLSVAEGELVCILGPSGCGKTTLLRMIGGLQMPERGKVLLLGADITDVPAEKRPTATVFQNYALFPHLNVYENVEYGLKYLKLNKKEKKEKVLHMLSLFHIEHYASSRVAELSGGEQQRVALARAIILQPKLLLMDEPLSSLDVKLKESLLRDIRALHKKLKTTVLYVTHDQWEAMSIADRIVLMNKGKIEQIGYPRELYCNPASVFAAEFLGRLNTFIWQGKKRYVRPEQVQIVAADNCELRGVIQESCFCGTYMEYVVEIQGQKILVYAYDNNERVFISGETVGLEIKNELYL